ncbi:MULTISPECIES: cytochrome P450 [unclassified Acidiplasma]|uniref:cytochrome P450 n=1 Tax=unclassified Acidiplasma TaxID=2641301 RepID=UPI0005E232FF|nr:MULTISPECIES: cytochrome P450 [unclassified Acidiplasma]KJE48614.1 cytochrome P450 [Acidiplasma sp. MBA-1]WMT55359.1 MAG: cytochrome P450 [Acidiplasma sp.]
MYDENFEHYKNARNNGGIIYNNEKHCWELYTYDACKYVLMHDDIFSSNSKYFGGNGGLSFINMDNPEHKEYRNIIAPYFMTSKINEMRQDITDISNELIKNLQFNSDIVKDYAVELPVRVISNLLGIPKNDREKFKEWSDYIIGNKRDDNFAAINNYMIEKLSGLFSENPENGIMSVISTANVNNRNLDLNEKIGYIMLLIIGGNETTTNLITNMLKALSDNEDIINNLNTERNIHDFIEETLRYYSPIQFLPHRFAIDDTDINGIHINKGQRISVFLGSANRDENIFDKPDEFILRDRNEHIAFGRGPHMCIGAPLARLEADIALNDFLENYKKIRIDNKKSILLENPMVYGYQKMFFG